MTSLGPTTTNRVLGLLVVAVVVILPSSLVSFIVVVDAFSSPYVSPSPQDLEGSLFDDLQQPLYNMRSGYQQQQQKQQQQREIYHHRQKEQQYQQQYHHQHQQPQYDPQQYQRYQWKQKDTTGGSGASDGYHRHNYNERQHHYYNVGTQPANMMMGIQIKRPATFVSPAFRCYIEDCADSSNSGWMMMSHANYLQAYERALHAMFMLNDNSLSSILETCTNMMPDGQDVGGLKRQKFTSGTDDDQQDGDDDDNNILLGMGTSYSDWSIVNVEHQQFRTTGPKLGCTYYIHGILVDQPKYDQEVWDCTMRESSDPNSPVYNFARCTIAKPSTYVPPDNIVADYAASAAASSMMMENDDELEEEEEDNSFITSTKEFFWLSEESHNDNDNVQLQYSLPLRNAMNLFERSRTNFLGGPVAIQRLRDDHGLIIAMTSINDMCKFPPPPPSTTTKDGKAATAAASNNNNNNRGSSATGGADLRPGQLVIIQTDFEVKSEGALLECHQTLLADDRPVAQASVTLMTLDSETMKPTSDLPDWLRDTLIYGPQQQQHHHHHAYQQQHPGGGGVQNLSFTEKGVPLISAASAAATESKASLSSTTDGAQQQQMGIEEEVYFDVQESNYNEDAYFSDNVYDYGDDGAYCYPEDAHIE